MKSCFFPILCLVLAGITGASGYAQSLKVSYGSSGIQTLSFNGVTLEDLSRYPGDTFHIGHMAATATSGVTLSSGDYGWGENCGDKFWKAQTHTWTYVCSWGSIAVNFQQIADTLTILVTEQNNSNSGITFNGGVIYPLALHFPQLPSGFGKSHMLAYNTTGPSVTIANYGSGEVAVVDPNASKPLYSGFEPTGLPNAYTTIVATTSLDSLASFEPHFSVPVPPGGTATFAMSVRFGTEGTPAQNLAGDVYRTWAKTWPPTLNWTDHRIIGTAYLASSPNGGNGNTNAPGGYPTNPRRWWNDQTLNVLTFSGLAAFQQRMLQQAQSNVANAELMGAQGVITWDIEGEQYPQDTSYVCSPDQIQTTAPEMESVISAGQYAGQKLDDAYFSIMKNAGLRIGVCIRPNRFLSNSNGTASQTYLTGNSDIIANLIVKMRYAHDRWGVTLFYVDSNVDQNGATLDASIYKQVAGALPDSLIMPEESTPLYYAYTAPFWNFLDNRQVGTDPTVRNYYPNAFSVNLINDVSAAVLEQYTPQITHDVKNGDVLMGHADWWQANNPTLVSICQSAAAQR